MKIYESIVVWIENRLSERNQRVVLRDTNSDGFRQSAELPKVPRSVLFSSLYINDIDEKVRSSLLQFADNIKILRLGTTNDYQILEKTTPTLALTGQIIFKTSKCKVVYFEQNNLKFRNKVEDQMLDD